MILGTISSLYFVNSYLDESNSISYILDCIDVCLALLFLMWIFSVASIFEEINKVFEKKDRNQCYLIIFLKRLTFYSNVVCLTLLFLRWIFSAASISEEIKKALDPVLSDVKPSFLGE